MKDQCFYSGECLAYLSTNPGDIVGTFGNGCSGEEVHTGRPRKDEQYLKEAGDKLRRKLCERMKKANLKRYHGKKDWTVDNCNHTVLTKK